MRIRPIPIPLIWVLVCLGFLAFASPGNAALEKNLVDPRPLLRAKGLLPS